MILNCNLIVDSFSSDVFGFFIDLYLYCIYRVYCVDSVLYIIDCLKMSSVFRSAFFKLSLIHDLKETIFSYCVCVPHDSPPIYYCMTYCVLL